MPAGGHCRRYAEKALRWRRGTGSARDCTDRSVAFEWPLSGDRNVAKGSRADIQTAGLPRAGALAQEQCARVAFVVGPFEGGYGTSLALKEEVRFNQTNVTSLDWNTYRTLRFRDHPAVTPIVVQRVHEQSTGAGEEVLPAVVAAIGNAFFDATGVRMRQFPLTPDRVLAALKTAPAGRIT